MQRAQLHPGALLIIVAALIASMLVDAPARAAASTCEPAAVAAAALAQVRGGAVADQASEPRVEITYPLPKAEVGEPIVVTFDITDATNIEDPRVPASPGLRSQVQRTRDASQMTIINGRVSQQRSVRYDVVFLADQPGRFEVPRVRVIVDGQAYESRAATVEVSGIDLDRLARAELTVDPEQAIVGQNVTVSLRVFIRNPRPGRMTVDAIRLWGAVVLGADSRWGPFQSAIEELYRESRFRIPPRSERDADGNEWAIYELTATLSPEKPGPLEVPGIEIRLRYPRGNAGERLITLEPKQPTIIVEPPPSEGRPADFTGAIGVFELDARAKPTRVSVGDPITLSVVIIDRTPGGADLARLLPPPVGDQADLQRSFRIPTEPLVGSVNGRTKVFTQTLRPLSERVTEIPPITFSYFDPATGTYHSLASKPIPITVMPVERIDSVAVTGGAATARPTQTQASRLTEVEGGLVASIPVSAAMLANERVVPGWGLVLLLVLPPLACGAAALARRRADRLGSDSRLVRARRALRNARGAIASASDAPAIAAALKSYLADRSGLAAASLTRREALSLIEQCGADERLGSAVDRLLAEGERSAFAQRSDASPEGLRNEARAILTDLERLDLAHQAGARS